MDDGHPKTLVYIVHQVAEEEGGESTGPAEAMIRKYF